MGVWLGWRGKLRLNEDPNCLGFWCPGCKKLHYYETPRWTFNGNYEKPSFTPSLLLKSGHYCNGQKHPPNCPYCNLAKEKGTETFCSVCHLFVTDGMIKFQSDCTHELKDKKVPLEIPPPRGGMSPVDSEPG